MPRAPFQVLVIPYRRLGGAVEFAVFRRADCGAWQFIAGGGEEGESIEQSARREAREEAGLPAGVPLHRLLSMSAIPACHFERPANWPPGLYAIPEYAFGVDCSGCEPRLSPEHTEYRWGSFEEIARLLSWDSNRNALWELSERLRAGHFG